MSNITNVQNKEYTPEKLAEEIFLNKPKEKNSCQLLLDQTDNEYIFELLLKFVVHGMNILFGENVKIENIDLKSKIMLNEYLNSIGFSIHIQVKEKEKDMPKLLFTDLTKNNYYCQIKLNDFPDYFLKYAEKYSGHTKYSDKYRYILNGRNSQIERNKLNDYYCLYLTENKKIKINFNYTHLE
jgi:hypothetical protein